MMDDKALEEKAFEFCEKSGCLHGASLTTLLIEVRTEAEAEVERLRDELTGKRAVERSKMRRYALSLQANLACPCGSVLQVMQELDDHLDHMCNNESWRDAALRGEGEK